MSLVDYDDSSSDDDVLPAEEDANQKKPLPQPQQKLSPIQSYPPNRRKSGSSLNEQEEENVEKLPDPLLLLETPRLAQVSGDDHASVVAAAMAESALRKRDLNGNLSALPRRPKLPRGNLPHSKNIPETLGNLLVPPQLKGRSNVATEDMSKLFVKKRQESSKPKSPNQE